ncbi:MAG: 2-aminoethylphosphonate-pyruvate transaminase [Gammaproteobacteria bacterium]
MIVTFHIPTHPGFIFTQFYELLSAKGYVIYPGKITHADTFRIGCIGDLGENEMHGALAAIKSTLTEMGITQLKVESPKR